WMIPSVMMVDDFGQLLSLIVRFSQYGAIAVLVVYILNARDTLPPHRILYGLAVIWAFVIAAGYLGILFPHGHLTYTVGLLLPESLSNNDYIHDLVFPPFAEVQEPWGAQHPFVRPSAPFSYSNGWGAAVAVLTPITVGTAIGHRSLRAVVGLIAGVVAMVPPAVATTNRGLLVGLGIALGYVTVRLLFRGRWAALLSSLLLGTVAGTGL